MSRNQEGKMTNRNLLVAATAVAAIACGAVLVPMMLAAPAAAQANPTMTNVVPDGGAFAIRGKLEAMNAGARTLSIMPEKAEAVPFSVTPGVSLSDVKVGDVVSAHYNRSVTFVVATPNVQVMANTTATVGQVATTPGGIGPGASVITGRVVKVDSGSSFDVVNPTGGGVYTIQTTDPAREALIKTLKAGDSVTVSVSPLTVNSIAKCGVLGLGLFGC
jgi:hypothetical protein